MGRNGSYVYVLDRNGASSTVKRVETSGGHTVTTLASNTADTPMDDPVALTLDPDNDFVYWLDEDDQAVRRVAADGATGTFETMTTDGGRRPHRPGGQSRRRRCVLAGQQRQPGEEDFRRWIRHGSGRDHLGPQRSELGSAFPGKRRPSPAPASPTRALWTPTTPPTTGRPTSTPPARRPSTPSASPTPRTCASPPRRHPSTRCPSCARAASAASRWRSPTVPTARPRPTCTWRRPVSTPSSWCGSPTRRTPPADSRPGCRPSPCCPAAT